MKLFTAREVAELLGVSPETVLRWTRRGELPGLRLPGGALRYRDDELEAWLADRETADAAGQELRDTRTSRARRARPYPVAGLDSEVRDTRPPTAASTDKES